MTHNEDLMRRIERDLIDSYDEELELEIEDRNPQAATHALGVGDTDAEGEAAGPGHVGDAQGLLREGEPVLL